MSKSYVHIYSLNAPLSFRRGDGGEVKEQNASKKQINPKPKK